MKPFKLKTLFLLTSLMIGFGATAQQSGYKILKNISIPGDGKWDFITFDESTRRLYLSHETLVQVVDIDQEKVIGEILSTPGVHGVAIASEWNKGYTSNGKDNTVTVFDTKSFKTLKSIALKGKKPDHILFDTFSKLIYVFNNKSGDISVIDPKSDMVIKDIMVGGALEISVSNKKGMIYVNVEDKHEIAAIDTKKMEVVKHIPLKPGEEPTGLAYDYANDYLFSSCHNKQLVIVNAITNSVVSTVPIGGNVDGAAFDPTEKLIFTSNGAGSVSVIRQDSKDKYTKLEDIKTQKGAKTIAIDIAKHRIYIPVADFGPLPAATTENPEPKAPLLPNTFHILVIGK